MTSAQLQAFVTLAQTNSFTSAAMMLGITQSAVSHAIKSLEDELGVSLFVRGKAEIVLTEVGKDLVGKAHSVLGFSESIKQTANEARNLQQGILRVGSFGPSFSVGLLPIILKKYRRRYPNINVYVEEGEDHQVMDWIDQRQVDLGSIILPVSDLDYIFLGTDKLSVILPSQHTLTTKSKITASDISKLPFILTQGRTGKLAMDVFRQQNCQPDIRYKNIQIMSMFSLVADGAGVSITADLSIPSELEKNKQVSIRPLEPLVMRQIGLGMQHREHLSPAAAAFVKIAAELQRAGALPNP